MTTVPETGLVYDLDEAAYHARPELSSSQARVLLDSPARYQYDLTHRTDTRAFDVGSAVHAKVLGVGAPVVAYPAELLSKNGGLTVKANEWADTQRADGLIPLKQADVDAVDAMAEAALAHPLARRILTSPGDPEVSVFATDPDTDVRVRARFDWLPDFAAPAPVAADLKTTAGSASQGGFGGTAAKYGYPIQEAWYLDALAWATGEQVPMVFIVVEKTPPYLVGVHELPHDAQVAGAEYAAAARHLFARCTATDTWPAYGDDLITTRVPQWWIRAADDLEEDLT